MSNPGIMARVANQFRLISRLGPIGWATYRVERLCGLLFPDQRGIISGLGLAGWIAYRRLRARHD